MSQNQTTCNHFVAIQKHLVQPKNYIYNKQIITKGLGFKLEYHTIYLAICLFQRIYNPEIKMYKYINVVLCLASKYFENEEYSPYDQTFNQYFTQDQFYLLEQEVILKLKFQIYNTSFADIILYKFNSRIKESYYEIINQYFCTNSFIQDQQQLAEKVIRELNLNVNNYNRKNLDDSMQKIKQNNYYKIKLKTNLNNSQMLRNINYTKIRLNYEKKSNIYMRSNTKHQSIFKYLK